MSATPRDSFTQLLDNSKIKFKLIEGSYSSELSPNYRQILQKVHLCIDYLNQDQKTFDWIVKNIDFIKAELSSGKSKGAIIVDSIALAKTIKNYLASELSSIRILENTGLSNESDKNKFKNDDFDLLIATSTVDIGVDFKINFLIFEAFSQGSFLQRLGRLGRHEGFENYKAYSLIPRHIYDKLEVSELINQKIVKRDDFNLEIKESFDSYNEFKGYINKWGILQSAQILVSLSGGRENYQNLKDRVSQKFSNTYFPKSEHNIMEKFIKKFYAMSQNTNDKIILEGLNTFRGGGTFDCGIYDYTDNSIKTYDLLFLIKNTNFKPISKDEFIDKYKPKNHSIKYCKFFVELFDYKDKTDTYTLRFDGDINDDCPEKINQLSVLSGFTIQGTDNIFINLINKPLYKEKLVCLISDMKARHLKTKYKLPIHFPLFKLEDESNSDFCIAFGKQAFLLDSLLCWKSNKKDSCFIV